MHDLIIYIFIMKNNKYISQINIINAMLFQGRIN